MQPPTPKEQRFQVLAAAGRGERTQPHIRHSLAQPCTHCQGRERVPITRHVASKKTTREKKHSPLRDRIVRFFPQPAEARAHSPLSVTCSRPGHQQRRKGKRKKESLLVECTHPCESSHPHAQQPQEEERDHSIPHQRPQQRQQQTKKSRDHSQKRISDVRF